MSDQPVVVDMTEVGVLQKFEDVNEEGLPAEGSSPVQTLAAVDGELVLIVNHPEPGVDDIEFQNPDHPKWNEAVKALGGTPDGDY